MKRNLLVTLLATLIGAIPLLAHAWGAEGHQQVGEIADQLISGTPAEQAVKSILGDLSLKTVAVWADCVKSVSTVDDQHFTYSDPYNRKECAAFANDAEKIRMESYVARNWRQCGQAAGNEFCHNQYHYTDVSSLRDHYDSHYAGTKQYDVVHAINAAIRVLKNEAAPAPFNINSKREALMLLVHYVGDLHQPLHVSAVYLTPEGKIVDPDAQGFSQQTDTAGGNFIQDGNTNMHSQWDAPISAAAGSAGSLNKLVALAHEVNPTQGELLDWSTSWAADSIIVSKDVFKNLSFNAPAVCACAPKANAGRWTVTGIDATYAAQRDAIKIQQISKAGARLAQILNAIWPDSKSVAAETPVIAWKSTSYLNDAELSDIKVWLPTTPIPKSAIDQADVQIFKNTRKTLYSERGMIAAHDDVYQPDQVAARFAEAAGITLTPSVSPTLMKMIAYVEADSEALVRSVKQKTSDGGRVRPFVRFPALASCIGPKDLAGHRATDLSFGLPQSGSYPSTHSMVGLSVAMILSEALPNRAPFLMKKGIEFGDSRVVCGFHYQSDVDAGRVAAAALIARLHANTSFTADMTSLKIELGESRQDSNAVKK